MEAGSTHTFAEKDLGNWDLTAITCDPSSAADVNLDELSVEVTAPNTSGADITCTFTNERSPKIRVIKYEDLDGNGRRNSGEPRLEGWNMWLFQNDGAGMVPVLPEAIATRANGVAVFKSLAPDTIHWACEEQREGWFHTEPNEDDTILHEHDGKELVCQKVEPLSYGDITRVEFGNKQQEHGDVCTDEDEGKTVTIKLNDNKDTTFIITYLGCEDNTWRYKVEEEKVRDLSHWMAHVGGNVEACTISGAPSNGMEVHDNSTDPQHNVHGVKWNVGDGFSSGIFDVTVTGPVSTGNVSVFAKAGPNAGDDTLPGPICGSAD